MNVKDFLAGVRARATVNDNENRITAHWVDESGRVVASHTAAAGDPIDYRSGLCGGDDGADDDGVDVELRYRGRPVYKLSKRRWGGLVADGSTLPLDVLAGIVAGCDAVEAEDDLN